METEKHRPGRFETTKAVFLLKNLSFAVLQNEIVHI